MQYPDYLSELKKLLSKDLNCDESDFDKEENILTLPALNEGRRVYSKEKDFFRMATLGTNAVISANEALFPFLKEFINTKKGSRLFDHPNLNLIEKELNKYGYALYYPHHMFLSKKRVQPLQAYPVKWFYGHEEINPFYGDQRFPNALCEEYKPERPDTIAVCAYDNDKIMGMAGCSEDAPHWLQIGIDVLPEYRSKGVGTYLVTLLKNKIEEQGDIPFYGTGLTHYHSWNIALNSGFKPVWAEIEARKKE